jgi:hypothetical protein
MSLMTTIIIEKGVKRYRSDHTKDFDKTLQKQSFGSYLLKYSSYFIPVCKTRWLPNDFAQMVMVC